MQALLKIGLTIRTQGQCAEVGGMLSAPGGAVKAQIAQNSRSGRDPCSDTTKNAAKSKSPRLRLWRARPDAWERWVARPSSVPAQEIFNIALFSLFVCCGILASFKSKISRFAWLFWPDRWHPKFPLICGKIFTQPEIWYEFSFDNLDLLVKGIQKQKYHVHQAVLYHQGVFYWPSKIPNLHKQLNLKLMKRHYNGQKR